MDIFLAFGFIFMLCYCLMQFARQEYVQEDFEDAIVDIEGRLEWAYSRTSFPFGMKAQLKVACQLLGKAKRLWKENKWHQAYSVALQSQKAMNTAQNIYSSALKPVGKKRQ